MNSDRKDMNLHNTSTVNLLRAWAIEKLKVRVLKNAAENVYRYGDGKINSCVEKESPVGGNGRNVYRIYSGRVRKRDTWENKESTI